MTGEVVDEFGHENAEGDIDVERQAQEAAKLASLAVEEGGKEELENIGHAFLALARQRGGGK